MLEASRIGDIEKLKSLESSGVSLELKNEKGWSALTVACFHQKMEVVKYLLSRKVNPNTANIKGTTALMFAKTHAKGTEILEMLLTSGADINAVDNFGRTILDYSLELNQPEITSFLIKMGARVASDLKNSRNLC